MRGLLLLVSEQQPAAAQQQTIQFQFEHSNFTALIFVGRRGVEVSGMVW